MDISALVNHPAAVINELSAKPRLVPFGFQSEHDFWRFLSNFHVMDVFTYQVWDDPEKLFREFLDTAYEAPKGPSR